MYTTSVTNCNGTVQVFSNCTINVYSSKTITYIQNREEDLQDKLGNEEKRFKEGVNKSKTQITQKIKN